MCKTYFIQVDSQQQCKDSCTFKPNIVGFVNIVSGECQQTTRQTSFVVNDLQYFVDCGGMMLDFSTKMCVSKCDLQRSFQFENELCIDQHCIQAPTFMLDKFKKFVFNQNNICREQCDVAFDS